MRRSIFGSASSSAKVELPAEFGSEAALVEYLGISESELKKIWWYRKRMYRRFNISKGSGKTREICAPNQRLKFIQRKILRVLKEIYRARNSVHGFVSNKSVKTNALSHFGARYLVNIDIKDFFNSISERRVAGLFISIGASPRVAEILARICCHEGCLPQGAPTSPILSNMICFQMDKELIRFAKGARCIYTRYADDITFSSRQPVTALFDGSLPPSGQFPPSSLNSALVATLLRNNFKINEEKAHYSDRHSRKMVTGLKINEFINVDRTYIRNLRAALHSVEVRGVKEAEEKYHELRGRPGNLMLHLAGKISWLRFIRGQSDPVFRSIAVRFNDCFPDAKIELTPTTSEIRDRAVWIVENDFLQGTAFFLQGFGLITAAHCVTEGSDIVVYHSSKPANKFLAQVLRIDSHRDLAVLSHSIAITEYFQLERSFRKMKIGDELTAVGYPSFGPGDRLNVRDGKVSSLAIKSGVKLLEVTQKLSDGMSGGPLLDVDNKVVGIIHKGGPGEGRDFAVNIEVLAEWLAV